MEIFNKMEKDNVLMEIFNKIEGDNILMEIFNKLQTTMYSFKGKE